MVQTPKHAASVTYPRTSNYSQQSLPGSSSSSSSVVVDHFLDVCVNVAVVIKSFGESLNLKGTIKT